MNYKSELHEAMCAFRNAVRPKKQKKPGMHYKHYTTLMQAMDLLFSEWKELSNNYTNYDKCDLVWGLIFKYLQISLPPVDRFGFARAFDDNERTAKYLYGNGSFPDAVLDSDELDGVSISGAIFGAIGSYAVRAGRVAGRWKKHMSSKNIKLAELMPQQPQQHPTGRVVCQSEVGTRAVRC
jgi:hypothetical protein